MPSAKRGKGRRKKGKASDGGKGGGARMRMDAETTAMTHAISKKTGKCFHGCNMPVPPICYSVLGAIQESWNNVLASKDGGKNAVHVLQVFSEAISTKNPEAVDDESTRKAVWSFLVGIGTDNVLMQAEDSTSNKGDEMYMGGEMYMLASIIVMLENGLYYHTGDLAEKLLKVMCRGPRELIRFYSKRVSCSCLKELRSDSKSLPKEAVCYNCSKRMERSLLRVCSKCKTGLYCCRACQVANWPIHKLVCSTFDAKNSEPAAAEGGGEE